MVYRGLVRDGVVILEGGIELPEGIVVTVEATAGPGLAAGSMEVNHSEKVDRHLGVLRLSSGEEMQAQQHLDRFL